jgi:hypothetical protein
MKKKPCYFDSKNRSNVVCVEKKCLFYPESWNDCKFGGKHPDSGAIILTKEDILDIEDKVMNAITAILWKLEAENHSEINKFIDKCNTITTTLIKHGIIPDRELYPNHEE